MNLNNIKIYKYNSDNNQTDFSVVGENKNIEVYFKNIENNIIDKIKKYKNVIGCVAWLTNENILKELAKKDTVIIIVQEEDFLRPDNKFDGNKLNWKNKIYNLYKNIEKNNGSLMLQWLGINPRWETPSGIRRLGKINIDKVPAFPRMHNKFIICFNDNEPYAIIKDFFKITYTYFYPEIKIEEVFKSLLHPEIKCKNIFKQHDQIINNQYTYYEYFEVEDEYSIENRITQIKNIGGNIIETSREYIHEKLDGVLLTGSYNYTENSNNSLENVICIKDQEIIEAYFKQFCELSTISVELDWNSEWKPHGDGSMRYGS